MTNVPGAGFLAVVAAVAALLSLVVCGAASLLVDRVAGLSPVRSLLAVHAAGAVVGAIALVRQSAVSVPPAGPASSAVGLVVQTAAAAAVGFLTAVVVEGVPVALGALGARVFAGVPWATGVRYGVAGFVAGGVLGVVGLWALTGSLGWALLGAALCVPGAVLAGPLLAVTVPRLGRRAVPG